MLPSHPSPLPAPRTSSKTSNLSNVPTCIISPSQVALPAARTLQEACPHLLTTALVKETRAGRQCRRSTSCSFGLPLLPPLPLYQRWTRKACMLPLSSVLLLNKHRLLPALMQATRRPPAALLPTPRLPRLACIDSDRPPPYSIPSSRRSATSPLEWSSLPEQNKSNITSALHQLRQEAAAQLVRYPSPKVVRYPPRLRQPLRFRAWCERSSCLAFCTISGSLRSSTPTSSQPTRQLCPFPAIAPRLTVYATNSGRGSSAS